MSEVSIVYNAKNAAFAEDLATQFENLGHTVFAGPAKLARRDQYRNINYYTKLTNALNVIIMDVGLYRQNREYIYQFCDALSTEQQNIQIISLDDEWPTISDEKLARLAATSYVSVRPLDGKLELDDLARKILDANEDKPAISHFNKERLECLLRGSYDPIALEHDEREQDGRIHYSVFKCTHRISGEVDRFVALYPSAAALPSVEHLKHFHPGVLSGKGTLHVVRSLLGHDMSSRQREYVESLFKGRARALRFESLISGRKLRSHAPERLTVKGEFVVPQRWKFATADGGAIDVTSQSVIADCMDNGGLSAQRRITILNGDGGAGKTHFARFLNDRLLASTDEVFFLSSASFTEVGNDVVITSLFDIYKHCISRDGERLAIDQDIFDLKFLVNSPVIIVDGLEEIITMLGDRFKLDSFYSDCIAKAGEGANGRIIITTRERAWPEELDEYVSCYTLQLFDKEQAIQFLDQSFPSDPERLVLAKGILGDMVFRTHEVPPLFCKVIVSELQAADSLDELSKRFNRGEFRAAVGLDSFLDIIISRETKLGPTWPPEKTKIALGKLASESAGGAISFLMAKEILQEAFTHHGDSDVNIDDAIRHFVLFKYDDESKTVSFKYDFLRIVFLAENIVRRILSLDLDILRDRGALITLTQHLVPRSDAQSSILSSMQRHGKDEFFQALEIWIQALARGEAKTANERQTRQISSNLLFLRLAMDTGLRDRRDFTGVVKRLFADPLDSRVVNKLSIMLFGQDDRATIRFDFSGLVLRSAWFVASPVDEMIEANEATVFSSCDFENCLSKYGKRTSGLWNARFDNSCRKDEPFSKTLAERAQHGELTLEDKASDLRRLLNKFTPNGHSFSLNRSRDSLQGMMHGVAVDKYIAAMRGHGLVEDVGGKSEPLIALTPKGRQAAYQFLRDKMIGEFKKVLREV
ncbi:MAG: NACHT domain-containing protein [Chitinophagaceae bacterium]|nr:MAG: NACHT domain-containing protein [Chitinophagaceae bacterium]